MIIIYTWQSLKKKIVLSLICFQLVVFSSFISIKTCNTGILQDLSLIGHLRWYVWLTEGSVKSFIAKQSWMKTCLNYAPTEAWRQLRSHQQTQTESWLSLGPVCTVRCFYNEINFLQNPPKRHPIARLLGWDIGCLLWLQTLIYILARSVKWCLKYHVILDRIIVYWLACERLNSLYPCFNEVERGIYWFHLVRLSICGRNRVCSISSIILTRSISYLHILSSKIPEEHVSSLNKSNPIQLQKVCHM